jgi:hypothetical protein
LLSVFLPLSNNQNLFLYYRKKKAKIRRSNSIINEQTRRHSLRLTPIVKKSKSSLKINETSNRNNRV